MKEKKVGRVEFRITPESWKEFKEQCDRVGHTASAVVRDLVVAAIPYMQQQQDQWFPPKIVPAKPEGDYCLPLQKKRTTHPAPGYTAARSSTRRKIETP